MDYAPLDSTKKAWWKSRIIYAIAVAVVAAVIILVIVILAVGREEESEQPTASSLADAIQVGNLLFHLNSLQSIASSYNGSRTAITGYNASVNYVVQQLISNTNYDIRIQPFVFPFYQELQPPTLSIIEGTSTRALSWKLDFQGLRFGGSGNVGPTPVQSVGGGCNATNFAEFIKGNVALLARAELLDCNMTVKMNNAIQFGAKAALIYYDPGTTGLFGAGLENSISIPAFTLTYVLGQALLEILPNLEVSMTALTQAPPVTTMNVLALSKFGDPTRPMIVVGSHLDSVLAGPGINDNGSGSSTNLELALQTYRLNMNFKNRILFAWWAAEEFGLLGSKYFVSNLTSSQRADIALNLNFDMMSSPNFFRGIYNGSSAQDNIKLASGKIQQTFQNYFNSVNLATEVTPFTGRSDYGPFIENGIPAGGLASGAEVIKTADSRSRFGGYANVPYDPCYHLDCDTVENVNKDVFVQLTKGAAYTLATLAAQDNLVQFLNS